MTNCSTLTFKTDNIRGIVARLPSRNDSDITFGFTTTKISVCTSFKIKQNIQIWNTGLDNHPCSVIKYFFHLFQILEDNKDYPAEMSHWVKISREASEMALQQNSSFVGLLLIPGVYLVKTGTFSSYVLFFDHNLNIITFSNEFNNFQRFLTLIRVFLASLS